MSTDVRHHAYRDKAVGTFVHVGLLITRVGLMITRISRCCVLILVRGVMKNWITWREKCVLRESYIHAPASYELVRKFLLVKINWKFFRNIWLVLRV